MSSFIRDGFVSADVSELWAGYNAYLTLSYKDGTVLSERVIPCRTKEDAEEILDKFLSGEYDAE